MKWVRTPHPAVDKQVSARHIRAAFLESQHTASICQGEIKPSSKRTSALPGLNPDLLQPVAADRQIPRFHFFSVHLNNFPRSSDHSAACRNVTVDDDRFGPNASIVTDENGPEQRGVCPDEDVVTDRGVSLVLMLSGAAESHPVKENAVSTDHRRLANDNRHSVIAEEARGNLGSGMDLHPGQPAGPLRDKPGQEAQAQPVQRMAQQAMREHGMKARVQ